MTKRQKIIHALIIWLVIPLILDLFAINFLADVPWFRLWLMSSFTGFAIVQSAIVWSLYYLGYKLTSILLKRKAA